MRRLDLNNFYFLLFFSYITIFFWFSFFFIDEEEVHDIKVTWLITSCDIIDLEGGRRIWKVTSGHMCCNNHSSQWQMISYTVKLSKGLLSKEWGLQENSTRSPCYICPLYIYMAPGLCYNNIYLALKSMPLPHVLLLIHMCLP